MKISAQEAHIKTATVEVKALTISGKQVTLAVYRQLQLESLIDPVTGHLMGVPWGRVNYYWGDCSSDGAGGHLHVVWQKGNELRRDCIFQSVWKSRDTTGADQLVTAMWNLQAALHRRAVYDGDITDIKSLDSATFTFLGQTHKVFFDGDKDYRVLREYLNTLSKPEQYHPHPNEEYTYEQYVSRRQESTWQPSLQSKSRYLKEIADHKTRYAKYRREYEERLARCLDAIATITENVNADEIKRLIQDAYAQGARFEKNWLESYQAIEAIDQLFIAV